MRKRKKVLTIYHNWSHLSGEQMLARGMDIHISDVCIWFRQLVRTYVHCRFSE